MNSPKLQLNIDNMIYDTINIHQEIDDMNHTIHIINKYGISEDIYQLVTGRDMDELSEISLEQKLSSSVKQKKTKAKENAVQLVEWMTKNITIKSKIDARNSSVLFKLYNDKLDNIDSKSSGNVKAIDIKKFNNLLIDIASIYKTMETLLSYPVKPIPQDRVDYDILSKYKLEDISLNKSGYLGQGKLYVVKKLTGGIMHHGATMLKLMKPMTNAVKKKLSNPELKEVTIRLYTANKQFKIKEQLIMLGFRSMRNVLKAVKTK